MNNPELQNVLESNNDLYQKTIEQKEEEILDLKEHIAHNNKIINELLNNNVIDLNLEDDLQFEPPVKVELSSNKNKESKGVISVDEMCDKFLEEDNPYYFGVNEGQYYNMEYHIDNLKDDIHFEDTKKGDKTKFMFILKNGKKKGVMLKKKPDGYVAPEKPADPYNSYENMKYWD